MAFGDVGGAAGELIITCRTISNDPVHIKKGAAVQLVGPYTVHDRSGITGFVFDGVFGQTLAEVHDSGSAVPVKVRGVCVFEYVGADPIVNGRSGVIMSSLPGIVRSPLHPYHEHGYGTVLKVDTEAKKVHVLL